MDNYNVFVAFFLLVDIALKFGNLHVSQGGWGNGTRQANYFQVHGLKPKKGLGLMTSPL